MKERIQNLNKEPVQPVQEPEKDPIISRIVKEIKPLTEQQKEEVKKERDRFKCI